METSVKFPITAQKLNKQSILSAEIRFFLILLRRKIVARWRTLSSFIAVNLSKWLARSEALSNLAGYAMIIAAGICASIYEVRNGDYAYQAALNSFTSAAREDAQQTEVVARAAFAQIYQNIRTISMLPSVKKINRHGSNLDDDALWSIQQIYNNLASNVAISEVYIVPVDLDPEKIDPDTGKLEEPILMFDELITAATRRGEKENSEKGPTTVAEAESVDEVEIYEYRQLRNQMTWFQQHYPKIDTIDGLKVPFFNGPDVITCDNSVFDTTKADADRAGVIFSVPFYGQDGLLKGTISAIMRTEALRAVLPQRNYALVNTSNDYIAKSKQSEQVDASLPWVRQGMADPTLLASDIRPINLDAPGSEWSLWMGRPDTEFTEGRETTTIVNNRDYSVAATGIVTLLALLFWRTLCRRRAAERAQWRDLSEAALEGLVICDGDAIVSSNQRFNTMIGRAETTLNGSDLFDLIVDSDARERLRLRSSEYIETKLKTGSGKELPVEMLARAITFNDRPHLVLAVRDLRDLHEAEKRIRFLALRDPLTGLSNRNRLRDELDTEFKRAERGEKFSLLCLDLDSFKPVNDTLGHGIGDQLLKAVAGRIEATVRDIDTIARIGGDEFAVIQTGANHPEAATSLASRLIEEIGKPYQIDGHQVVIGTSIGIALAPSDGQDADTLLKNADLALYRAKAEGRRTFRLFEPEMDAKMQARRLLELDLRQALDLDQFEVHYQSIVTTSTRSVCGFEALIRWRHPTRGLVAPLDFIFLAEEIGIMGSIGAWVLKKACADATKWPEDIRVAVNVSSAQFKDRSLELDVMAALGASGLAPQRLEIEITESVLLENCEATIAILESLRERGVRIAMDDFGTGYSSLSYLQKFPFDKIKIDRSFVRDSETNSNSLAIIHAVVGLGSGLGMSTTAEGIETEEQMSRLADEGCTEVQGYLFSKPIEADRISHYLEHLQHGMQQAS